MASKKCISAARLRTIFERQDIARWGSEYQPSILATPQEAPSISHASILTSGKLGRGVHTLSVSERHFALLALYHPGLVDLHDQMMLSPGPRVHPLFGCPNLIAPDLPSIKGLIDVADRLGYLNQLPRLKIGDPEDLTATRTVVFPYIGDFLIFLRTEDDLAPYCVNWSLKDTEIAFKRPGPTVGKRLRRHEQTELILARHQIEETYHTDADIRTIRLSGDQIDPHVAANLSQLFGYHRKTLTLPVVQQQDILEKFRAAMESAVPPMEVVLLLCAQGKATSHDCRTILYRGIWERQLRVDLFQPVLIDHPLQPEQRDVLNVYADWFRG